MSVLPRERSPRSGATPMASHGVRLCWRVIERATHDGCVEVELVATAGVDGSIHVEYAGIQLEQPTLNLHSNTFDITPDLAGYEVQTWTNGNSRPILRLLRDASGNVVACRTDIPQRMGVPAGTYELRDTVAVPFPPSID
ncbi:MAG: hypothetical protein MK085_03355 [Phycisphaerales bacterium]|nr:hypothetical protein [Phycisphaerales bacterium]